MNKQNSFRLLVGGHMSVAGGLEKSIERGESIGCSTIQIFTKSNRQWSAKPLTEQQITTFKETKEKSTINPVITHASYLINLAASNDEFYLKSAEALRLDLSRCEELEIPYLVLHPGSNAQEETGLNRVIKALDMILEESSGKTMILLETMAGQGSGLCATFEQIQYIRSNLINKHNVGICVDTCHIFAAGYDFRTEETYKELWEKFDSIIGLENLKVFHVNDSKKELGSRVDRHEHIGKGKIGIKAFELLMNDERFFNIPKIVETPKGEEAKEELLYDQQNIDTLKLLLTKKTKQWFNI